MQYISYLVIVMTKPPQNVVTKNKKHLFSHHSLCVRNLDSAYLGNSGLVSAKVKVLVRVAVSSED